MAQLFFRYGVTNSGKSIDILKVKHNYEEQGKNVLLITSALDTRDGVGNVSSRIGISQPAEAVDREDDIRELMNRLEEHSGKTFDCILVDEAQFLSYAQVADLAKIVDDINIPVICYGLKNDFMNELFEGSKTLLVYADKIEEIKTLCWYCTKKATMNLRLRDGKPSYLGEQVMIGGNESYKPVCRKHYHAPLRVKLKRLDSKEANSIDLDLTLKSHAKILWNAREDNYIADRVKALKEGEIIIYDGYTYRKIRGAVVKESGNTPTAWKMSSTDEGIECIE